MKITELRNKTEQEITEMLKKFRTELKDARIGFVQKKDKNVKKPLQLRKEIARILTVLNEKSFLKNSTKDLKVEKKEDK